VASYLCQVQTIQRSQGRSVVAAAAYRSGASLTDERLAMEFDFAGKDGVEHSEVMLPEGAPEAFRDRQVLWNAAEASEARKDAVPAREVLLALPHELDFEQRRALVRAFVAEHITGRGMVADIAMHKPGQEGDQRNFHAHILVSTRQVTPEGFGKKDPAWWSPKQVRDWRAGWAEIQNAHLRHHLGPDAPQVSHQSLAAQGIDRDPTEHLGPAATALERRNRRTDRGERNRDIRARNDTARRDRRDYSDTAQRIEAAAPVVDAPIDKLVVEATRVRAELMAERSAWTREREALKPAPVRSSRQIERDLLEPDRVARARARGHLQQTETRIKRTRERRNALLAWIRNPARMIYAKHAELNALARARAEVRRTELRYAFRQTWLRSPPGQIAIANRRQPDLDRAAQAAGKRRTLERKIKRMDKRIASATRTLNDLIVAQELGERSFKVPAQSPDAIRFIRSVGAPARAAIARHPVPARTQAIDRLNKGLGRRIARTLFPTL
jgi:ATP-dependent exoDNAse (exonuclease V) alpha subunit